MPDVQITRASRLVYKFEVSWACVKGIITLAYYVIVRPLSTVGYTSVVASVIHSRQWSN